MSLRNIEGRPQPLQINVNNSQSSAVSLAGFLLFVEVTSLGGGTRPHQRGECGEAFDLKVSKRSPTYGLSQSRGAGVSTDLLLFIIRRFVENRLTY